MLLTVDKYSGLPVYRQVMDQIRWQIAAGRLAAGEQLPSVRDLAGQLQVNPMTVSKAYSLLERDGFLERRAGIGLFVAAQSPSRQQLGQQELLRNSLQPAILLARQLGLEHAVVRELVAEMMAKPELEDGDE